MEWKQQLCVNISGFKNIYFQESFLKGVTEICRQKHSFVYETYFFLQLLENSEKNISWMYHAYQT